HVRGSRQGRCRLTRQNVGGSEGTRTPNPRLAKAVLCQLSYAPGYSRGTIHYRGSTLWVAAEDGGKGYRRSDAVVASCQRARSSLAERTFLAMMATTPTTLRMISSFFTMWG